MPNVMIDNPNDPSLQSFIDVPAESPFPIQNLPFGVCHRGRFQHVCVAIGEYVVLLRELEQSGLTPPTVLCYSVEDLCPRAAWRLVRKRISDLLRHDNPTLRDNAELRTRAIIPRREVEMVMPWTVGNYTDFYSSREHATNVGIMLRGPDNALMPNWLHLPVAYHGRASSVVVSGTDVVRPHGQTKADDAAAPTFGPSRSLDFELELGMLI